MLVFCQDIRLGLHRSDYMLDLATGDLLQVELNTISSSFAGLGSVVSKLHKLSSIIFYRGLFDAFSKVKEGGSSKRLLLFATNFTLVFLILRNDGCQTNWL